MIREHVIVGLGTEFPLQGIKTFPEDISTPVPAVVMVHGSGPSDRDERVMKLTPFKDLADGLAGKGIASIRYDKRTFAHRRKMARLKDLTVKEETIEDAILALELLREDPRIDNDNIYILGHSMGAMLAPRIDAEGGNAKGLIMMAGTPYRLEEVVLRQLKQSRGSNSALKWVIGLENKIIAKQFAGLYQMTDEEAKKKRFGGTLPLYYFKELGQKTATDYLLENTKPVLIMQGERDFQVLADDDFRKFRELIGDRENTEFKLYPGLDHVFVEALYDDILKASKEYSVERHIGEAVTGDIAEFIMQHR